MITKNEAIQIGQQIVKLVYEVQNEPNDVLKNVVVGTCISAMDKIWSNVFCGKVHAYFNYRKENFYDLSGWKL